MWKGKIRFTFKFLILFTKGHNSKIKFIMGVAEEGMEVQEETL